MKKVVIVLGILLIAVGCNLASGPEKSQLQSANNNSKKNSMAENMSKENLGNKQCVGRFAFSLPDYMVASGGSQSIYTVNVLTIPSPNGFKAVWDQQLKEIAGLTPPSGVSNVVIKSFDLEPNVPAVWYYRSSDTKELLSLKVMSPFSDHILVVERGADLRGYTGTTKPQEIVEKLVKNVVDAYVPKTDRGFCVGFGAITSSASVNENTLASFSRKNFPDLTFSLRFETRTVLEPDTTTYSDLDEESRANSNTGSKITVITNGERTLGVMKGKEIKILVESPDHKEDFVRFTWHFPGLPKDAFNPAIDVVGIASINNQKDLETTWEELLQSLQQVPR